MQTAKLSGKLQDEANRHAVTSSRYTNLLLLISLYIGIHIIGMCDGHEGCESVFTTCSLAEKERDFTDLTAEHDDLLVALAEGVRPFHVTHPLIYPPAC